MKHLLSTITVLFILLTSTVGWGGVDGKGLYCSLKWSKHKYLKNDETLGFNFVNGSVGELGIRFSKDKYIIVTFPYQIYKTTEKRIDWTFNTYYRLNRETLRLDYGGRFGDSKGSSIYECEVYPNSFKLNKRLNNELVRLQKIYDEKRKGNKI